MNTEPCNSCGVPVAPQDPHFSSPCGTFCTPCFEAHVDDCAECREYLYGEEDENDGEDEDED